MEAVIDSRNRPFENQKSSGVTRIEALKTLAKLILYEVESLAGTGLIDNEARNGGGANFVDKIQYLEVELICRALQAANGNQRRAAELLGLKATTLNSKMKRYEIDSLSISGKFYSNAGS